MKKYECNHDWFWKKVVKRWPLKWQSVETCGNDRKKQPVYGGTCINEGCIPSKSLIIQADKTDIRKQ